MNAWMYLAGWTLVHFVWQGAAIAIAAALILRLCRQQTASLRYVIACGAMVAMLGGVAVTATLLDVPTTDVSATPTSSVPAAPAGRTDTLLPIHITHTATPAEVSYARRVEALLPWIVSAWLCGVLLLLARVTAAWWRVRRLHAVALSTEPSSWQAAANRIASRLGLLRIIQIVELPQIDVPLVVGCLRPVVVLPIAALSSLNAAQVVRRECAPTATTRQGDRTAASRRNDFSVSKYRRTRACRRGQSVSSLPQQSVASQRM